MNILKKNCHVCAEPITLNARLMPNQTDEDGKDYVIDTLIVECSKGHKNPVGVNHLD